MANFMDELALDDEEVDSDEGQPVRKAAKGKAKGQARAKAKGKAAAAPKEPKPKAASASKKKERSNLTYEQLKNINLPKRPYCRCGVLCKEIF